jgi:hypothetical protein
MIGSNRETVSSVRRMTRHGMKLFHRHEKLDKLEDHGYMDCGILGLWDTQGLWMMST